MGQICDLLTYTYEISDVKYNLLPESKIEENLFLFSGFLWAWQYLGNRL